jgi:hypothetical protein
VQFGGEDISADDGQIDRSGDHRDAQARPVQPADRSSDDAAATDRATDRAAHGSSDRAAHRPAHEPARTAAPASRDDARQRSYRALQRRDLLVLGHPFGDVLTPWRCGCLVQVMTTRGKLAAEGQRKHSRNFFTVFWLYVVLSCIGSGIVGYNASAKTTVDSGFAVISPTTTTTHDFGIVAEVTIGGTLFAVFTGMPILGLGYLLDGQAMLLAGEQDEEEEPTET